MALLNTLHYAETTWKCKHHRPHLVFKSMSPVGVHKVAHALFCPKCRRFGLEFISQSPKVEYSMPVYGTPEK